MAESNLPRVVSMSHGAGRPDGPLAPRTMVVGEPQLRRFGRKLVF